jgi:hypothetical protein
MVGCPLTRTIGLLWAMAPEIPSTRETQNTMLMTANRAVIFFMAILPFLVLLETGFTFWGWIAAAKRLHPTRAHVHGYACLLLSPSQTNAFVVCPSFNQKVTEAHTG